MKATTTKSIRMTYRALLSYVLNTNYRSVSGVVGLALSIGALVLCIVQWGNLSVKQKIVLLFVASVFTVINPLMLALKTFRQYKLSVSYKNPITYTFGDEGIRIEQGEQTLDLSWDKIVKLMLTSSMFAIYTNRIHAFVIPLSELGEEKAKIMASVVQFTEQYRPHISGSLKGYRTGKGIA